MAGFVVEGEVRLVGEVRGEGPTLLLLHGWPDTRHLWDDVVEVFVDAGYRAAAVDLRGCGESDKPASTEDYAMHHLVGDVAAVIDHLGAPVTLIGHDWGAALAWAVATFRPDLVEALVVLSVGHPSAFRAGGLNQQMKSWYTLLFFHEGVGEAFLRMEDYGAIRRWLHHPRAEAVIAELERDGQMSSHLRWYRANLPPDAFVTPPPVLVPVQAPTLGVWSSGDVALTETQMTASASFCANGFTYRRLEGLGHWMVLEDPPRVAGVIIEFLAGANTFH
ncbi:MAG: alpha/beta fold hydrolase [Acidobacteriota bacterium]|nr:alpha/beta fold hydrolase [Acidobacteriota bacterium]